MTEFFAKGYLRQSSWPSGTEDRVLGPGVLMTEFLAGGVLMTEFLAQG